MKINKNWQEQWDDITVPDKQIEARVKAAFGQQKKKWYQRPAFRNTLIIAAILFLLVSAAGTLVKNFWHNGADSTASLSAVVQHDASQAADENGAAIEENTNDPASAASHSDKTAYFYTISKETADFESDLAKLHELTEEANGYLESSTTSQQDAHWAQLTVRIPTESTAKFLKAIEKIGKTTQEDIASDNYSLQYSDNESRIKALQTEEDALLAMLEKSTTVEEALQIQNQLSTLRTERENLTKDNRWIDNQVNYATFDLSLTEITTFQKNAGSDSAWTKIQNNWQKQKAFWQHFFAELGIFLASNFLYLVLVILIITGVIFYRKKKQRP